MVQNKVIMITGAAGRIGSAFAEGILKNGGKVIIADIFDEGAQIAGNSNIGLYRVKIKSTNGLYLTPSKSFQGLNNRTTKSISTRSLLSLDKIYVYFPL